jgi:hypothetical protein
LAVFSHRISQTPAEYSLGVYIHATAIQYCLGGTVGSARCPWNIHWVYLSVRLTVHPILSE